MSRWLVTQNDTQFAVNSLNELKALATEGKLRGGDMVQPPGAADWIYAAEIAELKEVLDGAKGDADDDFEYKRSGALGMVGVAIGAIVLLGILIIGGGVMGYMYTQLPTGEERLIGEGGSFSYSEMLVTEANAPLHAEPVATSATVANLEKDLKLELLAKRAEFYKARSPAGQEGWIRIDHVIPMYQLGGVEIRAEYDPLYNPDRYVNVRNARWRQVGKGGSTTVFHFMLGNSSKYPMTDLVIQATIKDEGGRELEKLEIPMEGIIPAARSTMVGTLAPEKKGGEKQLLTEFTKDSMLEEDPELALRYSDGVEVEMNVEEFALAEIDIIELRANPIEVD